ncbi:hypothetical protein AAG570_009898 [Ranatra chinensis]|uniref:Nuclear pore complex protein n=1 Tax=Ranatra chinensis TaxID=642074 RepID=A0ABD0Z177_9HEMI
MSECNTWRLVHGLYRDRVLHQDDDDNGMGGMLGDLIHPLSEKDLAENLYNNESSVRECQLIIDWLEKISGDEWNLMSRRPDVGHFTDRTVGWENTLHQLQNSVVPYMSTRSIVSSLDPDAPLRENRPLHDLDVEDEERLLDQVFFEIRCGRLSRAQELCVHCGQAWRGAVLEGWRLHHDPNYRTQEEGTPTQKLPVEGNPNRDVWKLCAWRLCEEPNAHPRDKSILGALCGHLGALLPACSGWEDLLWAYLRAAVDRRVEREIRDNAIRQYVPMPNKYWLNVEGIFREIRANELAKHEAKKPERVIQELLALDLVPDLLERMSEWVETTNCQPQFVRFLAHLVIILRLVGRSQPQELGDNVLRAYIKILVDEGEPNLVAYYVAMMPDDDQIDLYATFLESVTDSEKRIECLRAAEKYELNIKRITQKVVQNIRNRRTELEDTDETLARKASDEDFSKISALDWVVFYPQQRGEAIWQANALVRTFIGQGKLEAARLAFDKIPADSIEMLMTQFKCKVDEKKKVDVNLPPRISSAIKEYLCHKAYLDAQDGFSDWFHHFHNTKPTPPPEPKNKDDFAEKVAHEHKLKMFNEELERWKVIMKHQTKSVKSQLYNIIVFPDGGWLVDENNEDEGRSNQLRSLRSICIPEIVMLLHKVLHSVEEYDECIDLAPLIMDETPGLYKVTIYLCF